jgi:hypothetical protein
MKKIFICCLTLSLLSITLSASAATTLYESVFSVDPGWATDQPGNYYWDGVNDTYHLRSENLYPAYQPSRYAYHLLPKAVDSFVLQWDMYPTRADWSGATFVGIYDSHLRTGGMNGQILSEAIQAGYGRADDGSGFMCYVAGTGGEVGRASFDDLLPDVPLNEWYTCKLTYDDAAGEVRFEVWERDTLSAIWSHTFAVPGGGFTHELKYLGSARGGIGDSGSYPGLSPEAVGESNIDNLSLIDPTEDVLDTDGDGIPDDMDSCPESDLKETIIINCCDSGVINELFDDGCTMSDLIAECAEGAKNHGKFVSCVAHLTNGWKKNKLISGREKGAIQSCAAKWDRCEGPTVRITEPTPFYFYDPPGTPDFISLAGTAFGDYEIVEVTWSNNRGGFGIASGTENWSVEDIPLFCGNHNIITITAEDSSGATGEDTLTVDVAPCPPQWWGHSR